MQIIIVIVGMILALGILGGVIEESTKLINKILRKQEQKYQHQYDPTYACLFYGNPMHMIKREGSQK